MRAVLLALAVLTLAGCGFRPLYASGVAGAAEESLAQIRVGPVTGARAQDARNLMREALPARFPQADGGARFVVAVDLSESIQAVSVSIDSNARRFNYYLIGRVTYIDTETNERRQQTLRSIVSYAVVPSQYASLVGREDAVRRAVIDLARKIENDAVLYANGQPGGATDDSIFNRSNSQDPLRNLERDAETDAREADRGGEAP